YPPWLRRRARPKEQTPQVLTAGVANNGRHHDRVVEYHIDPRRGSSDDADQQRAGRDRDLAEASPAACARLRELHSAYPIEEIPPARS
ncbi:hypothetical protein ACW9HR_37450, partial [Nocardia gipuzkoensis]